jgi:CRP-like cAMP-binding protein
LAQQRSTGIAAANSNLRAPLFDGLAPPDVDAVFAAATKRRYPAGSVIVNQGDPAECLFLLIKGRARYSFFTAEGQKSLFLWLAPGDIFGEKAILSTPSRYIVSTEAVKESWVLVWNRGTLIPLAARYPRLLENALSIAADYLTWFLANHLALAFGSAQQKLAHVLLELAGTIGQKVPGGVELEVTNEDLANAASITPFTASRLLSAWQRDRAIVKRRGKLLIRAPQRLLFRLA